MLTFQELLSFPSLSKGTVLCSRDRNRLLKQAEYIWAPRTLTATDCLYIVPEALFPALSLLEGVSLVMLGDTDTGELPEEVWNAVRLSAGDAPAFQEELSASEDRAARCRAEQEKLLTMVQNNEGLDAMAEELSNWLGRPIGIVDVNLRFLTRTMAEEMDSFVTEIDRNPQGVTQQRLQQLYEDGYAEKLLKSSEPSFLEIGDFTIYQATMRIDGVTIGVFGIPGAKSAGTSLLPPEYVHAMSGFADLFAIELSRNDMYVQNGEKNLAYLFSMILEQEPEETEELHTRMDVYGYNLLPEHYLMTVPFRAGESQSPTFLATTLQSVFSNCIYLIRNDDILFLITRPEHRGISEFEQDVWDSQLRRLGLHGGLSPAFSGFKGIRTQHLKEAELALRAGLALDSDKGLYLFEQYQVDAMLTDVATETDLRMYCFPPLIRLIEYDWQKKASLIETLRVYLENPKTHEACEKLYIHKNTLYKRIAKIEEIMGCSISDPDVIMKIQLTFHILQREPD